MSYHDIEGAHPATKEQRDTLIKAMADAGYAFDFEKKELKKIEQKPVWSQDVQEEPVSEDLDEAADEYATDFSNSIASKAAVNAVRYAFKAGANWQKEQIMAKAIDAHVNYAWSSLCFGGFDWSKTGLNIGDKCKLITIKDD